MTGGIAAGEPGAPRRTRWIVMVRLVAALLFLLGCWNVWDGIAALGRGGFVLADADLVLLLEATAWGWVLLAVGVVELAAAPALLRGTVWARVVAILVAGFNGVVQLAFLAAYPVGAGAILLLCVGIVWTVVRHGGTVTR
ncbi:DUF7144 family membrane protein [Pseudonocardia halophobica]|uniref:DUF7144 family membrane protein n=1 Tax=Pseudonocardia halophobica TaxID=29401 RepID=UPI003D8C7044